jgi:hypothetical protein
MTKVIHPVAGGIAVLTIAAFWLSTLGVELFGTEAQVVAVKTAIPYGLLVLVPALVAVGATGLRRAKGRRGGVLGRKVRRMPVIAGNGLLVLVPSALFLAWKAQDGAFDATFYAVQVVELLAGAVNLTLLGLSMRDGMRLTGRLRREAAPA